MTVEDNLANGEIRYVDRYSSELKTEKIYGERALRWVYGNPLGHIAQWLLIRRWIVSAAATSSTFGSTTEGCLASSARQTFAFRIMVYTEKRRW